jgi:methyl-accepting chemotaxis protein
MPQLFSFWSRSIFMFRNLSTATKILAGFGAMLLILTSLGGVSYMMFRKVSTNVNVLNDHSSKALKNAVGVERAAFEVITQERNYLIEKKAEYQQAMKKHLVDLKFSLDAIDKVAVEFDDADLAAKSKLVAEVVQKYRRLYDESALALQENDNTAATLVENVRAVAGEAQAYVAARQKVYDAVKEASRTANRIEVLVSQMRYTREKYINEDDQKWLDVAAEDAKTLGESFRKIKDASANAEEQKQIDVMCQGVQAYMETANKWRDERKRDPKSTQLAEIEKQNSDAGTAIVVAAADYRAAKEAAVEATVGSVFTAAKIGEAALAAQINTSQYMIHHKKEDWEAIRGDIEKLDELYSDLNALSPTEEDVRRIEVARRATEDYLKASTAWYENDANLRDTILPEMNRAGETVLATAQTAENDAWKSSDTALAAVLTVASSSKFVIVASLLAGLAAAAILGVAIARSIVVPIKSIVVFMGNLAQGDFSKDISEEFRSRGDELGDLGRSFHTMVGNTRSLMRSMMHSSQTVASSATELAATSTQLASGAEETTNQSAQVAAAAEQMSTNMNSMSASTEEMSSSIRVMASAIEELTSSISEVARSAERAAGVASNAAQLVNTSNDQIGDLGNAADQIGKVIEVIQDIAEQTNLLALNATIEAARAGDAGKGFAVVATEVKELAKQTAMATEDIRKRIEGIQGSTQLTVKSIGDISEVVKQVNELSRTIASSVDEQSITTKEIARNVAQSSTAAQTVARSVAESATATQEITRNIVGVDQAAKQTAQGAAQTQVTGRELSRVAEQLQTAVGQFKV